MSPTESRTVCVTSGEPCQPGFYCQTHAAPVVADLHGKSPAELRKILEADGPRLGCETQVRPGLRGRPKVGDVTSVRFPPALEAAAKAAAAGEGMNTTEWIRGIVGAELARRDGRCPACGQPIPAERTTP